MGNQMFQYAAGRAQSLQLDVPLGLDTCFYENSSFPFSLSHFNVQVEEIPDNLRPPHRKSQWLKWLLWRAGFGKPTVFREKGLAYNSAIETTTDTSYLIGYWQSEHYFKSYIDVIRQDFNIRTPPSKCNSEILAELQETDSTISLHVRRGDYVRNRKTSRLYETCSMDYYERAVKGIAENCETTPVVFAFSDDPEWVSENLKLPVPIRVMRHNTSEHCYEDIRLMSACRHHVIANSSFSWWGAWLNPRADKFVVAPSRWFAHRKYSNPDIWCKDWCRI